MDNPLPHLGLARPLVGLSVLLALLIWESWKPFFPFFERAVRTRSGHLARNLAVGLLNAALIAAGLSVLWGVAAAWSAKTGFGILHRAGMPLWLHACAAVLVLDVWTYWWHRANHRIPLLWRFHRMHHSDPWMDVTSARRFHPGEIVLSSLLRVPLIALLGVHLWELVLYELLMGMVVDFQHANIALPEPVDRLLRTVIVTPAMHKVHHSRIQAETDSNYTSLLSLWDRVFSSFRLRPELSAVRIGLVGWSDPPHQTLPGMLTTPLQSRPTSGPAPAN
jgi:sterol desaturase/sphingolipid hydroxylase (fatty acid hydroxylase superfamily)